MNVIERVLMDTFDETLVPSSSNDTIHYLKPSTFGYFKTYDGIKVNGDRVIAEIFKELEDLKLNKDTVINKISIVGYSLGGLISRYIIGELYEIGFFDSIEPINFTTFATPHLGVKFFKSRLLDRTLNFLGSHLLGYSGRDLFIYKSTILCDLANKDMKYYKGLEKFKLKIIVANIKYDRTVAFATSYITNYNPFEEWDSLNLKFIEDLPGVTIKGKKTAANILDMEKTTRDSTIKTKFNVKEHSNKRGFILSLIMVLFPFVFPIFLTATLFGSIKSTLRKAVIPNFDIQSSWNEIQKILKGEEDYSDEIYSSKSNELFNPIAAATQDIIEDTLNESEFHDNLESSPTPQLEKSENEELLDESWRIKFNLDHAQAMIPKLLSRTKRLKTLSELEITKDLVELPYDEKRTEMCNNLNDLDWIKLPVFLKSLNAHEAIVSRRGLSRTTAGTPVIFLWASMLKKELEKVN
ncbi:hypothetical protein CANARDRAFT_217007 [[Candida] arabinofermentans NRRL YB-2248]|uniref:DUF676 domain-containing protein n=1 Tax=[Candida] arabinofermentans NRRL YB-2248 TaxID=983967 RepID=A0A1E4T620_9ASCO|nr:hypothetical protein CANARDRAFT_217007 [[Candida] arabinofermentans NRRL YB-2248]